MAGEHYFFLSEHGDLTGSAKLVALFALSLSLTLPPKRATRRQDHGRGKMTDFRTIPPRMSVIGETAAPMFNGQYQLGFVTDDLDAAMARLGRRYDISSYRVKRDPQRMSTAHAYAGDMMIEVIQPGPDANPVYHENVPTGGTVRLHHLGYRVPDVAMWDQLIAQIDREGWATPVRGAVMDGHLRFVYVDTLADLGIYQEYVCLTGEAVHYYDDVPAN